MPQQDDDPATSDDSLLETALKRYGNWWSGGGVSKMLGMHAPSIDEYAQQFGTDAGGGSFASMIAGRNALTANKVALAIAEDMAKKGKDRTSIFQRTGWWQGPDKEWRYEIHDPSAEKSYNPLSGETTAQDLLEHPALWKAYPSLGRTAVEAGSTSIPPEYAGDYMTGRIRLSPEATSDPEFGHSVLSHELQHGIQDIEQFGSGPDPKMLELGGATPDEAQNIYERSSGEVEARTVQRRLGLSPIQRRVLPPYSSGEHGMDVPEAEQLIFDTNGQLRTLEPVEGNPFEEKQK